MRKDFALLSVSLLAFATSHAFADIASIHADALPQETAVLAALDDARQLEPYSRAWTQDWKYPIAKTDVAARLEKDLSFLQLALKDHPDNGELLMLAGLVAHYAYNLDVPDTHDKAISAYDHAQELAPKDARPRWFRANLRCQTKESKSGAEEFLAIEDSYPWEQLPPAFWDDYIACATITNMPAHALRAADHLGQLHATGSDMRNTLVKATRERFSPFDPNRKYEPKEVWEGSNTGEETQFLSRTCGVRVSAHGNWTINQLALKNGSCVAYFSTGPYKAVVQNLRPGILLLVQQPNGDETLQEFLKKFLKDGRFEPFTPSRCPTATCLSMKGLQPGMYKVDGDGHGRIVVFERDQPQFPGLIFESPLGPPQSGGGEGMKYYHPGQVQQRIPGKLFYLVLLDTAASIENHAMEDFDFFLQSLTVE